MSSSPRTRASLTSIGRLTPAMTSISRFCITEMARLDGVPPNMSVRMTTPSPVSARPTAADDVVAALFHVVVRTDGDGFALLLRTDDMFERGAKFFRQPAMCHKHHADHTCPRTTIIQYAGRSSRLAGDRFQVIFWPRRAALAALRVRVEASAEMASRDEQDLVGAVDDAAFGHRAAGERDALELGHQFLFLEEADEFAAHVDDKIEPCRVDGRRG